MTTVEQRGVARVDATAYGNPVTYTPDDRPANAIDGDPRTAWRVGAFSDVRRRAVGGRARADAATTDHLTVLQPITGSRNRFITKVRLEVRRSRSARRRARRLVALGTGADDRHRVAHLHDAVDRDPRHRRRLSPELQGHQPGGVRRARCRGREGRRGRAPPHRPAHRGGHFVDRPPARRGDDAAAQQPRRAGAHRRRGDLDPAGVRSADRRGRSRWTATRG